ncbi:MAG: tripartite tricarboxylate transporter substrate-binding protein [Xanthobacteraceae bacterium]
MRPHGKEPAKRLSRLYLAAVALLLWAAWSENGSALDAAANHSISVIVGFSPGGAYDLYARVLAKHMGKYLPGKPTLVVENMPGAGGLKAANYLYQVAPKDGSTFGTFARGVVIGPLFGQGAFDATKFSWIGSVTDDVNVCLSWHTSQVKTWNDVMTKPFTVAGQGPQADPNVYANLVKNLFDAPISVVNGYPGSNEIVLAMERGEVDGVCALSYGTARTTLDEKIKNKDINIVFQAGLKKAADLPDVPLLLDLARDDTQRAILKLVMGVQGMARPFVAPPGLPQARTEELRTAFVETMSDPAFIAEANRLNLEVNPVPGRDVEALVADLYRTPRDVVEQARRAIAER